MSGNQHAILVNHPNAQANGIQWRPEGDLLPINKNLAFIGLYQPEEDLHQSGLASAVLAENGVNFTCSYLEIDMVIGCDTWVSLRDSSRLQDRVTAFCL